MPKRCEMCNLDLQDEYSYQGHIQGKRHLKNAEQLETVHSLVQRSIFVSRIPPYIPSNNLLQFFAQFGEIIRHRFAQSHLILEYKNKYVYISIFQCLFDLTIFLESVKNLMCRTFLTLTKTLCFLMLLSCISF